MTGMSRYDRYPRDWLGGTRTLTFAERGLYSDLVDIMYDTGKPVPLDWKYLCRALAVRDRRSIEKPLQELLDQEKVVIEDGRITNRRWEREHAAYLRRAADGAKGGSSRHDRDTIDARSPHDQDRAPTVGGTHGGEIEEKQELDTKPPSPSPPPSVSKEERLPVGSPKKAGDALAIPSFLKRDGPQPEHVDQPTQQNPKTEPVCQPPAEQASEPKARAKTTRRTGLPAGWAPNGTIPTQQWKTACDQGAVEDDIRDHWGEFCNSAEAHGRLYANWPAAWRTWLGNIERFSGNGRSRDNDQQRTDSGRRALLDSVGLGVADSGPGAKPPGTVH